MVRKFFIVYLTMLALISTSLSAYSQGYQIKFKIDGLENSELYLGHYFASNKNTIVDDTVQFNAKGIGISEDDEPLPGGMYFIYFDGKLFNIIIDDEQHFTIESDTTNFTENIKIKGSEQNKVFYEYQQFLTKQGEKAKEIRERYDAAKSEKEKKEIREEFKTLDKEVKQRIDQIIGQYPKSFLAAYLKATKDVEMPGKKPDTDDENWGYNYYKRHYFDNFEITDTRLLRTPVYENKIQKYIEFLAPIADSIKPEVDRLIEMSRIDDDLFRFMLITIHNHYASSQIMGMDEMFVYIAEKYYIPEAHWSSPEYINKLKEQVRLKKQNLLGLKAKPLKMQRLPNNKEFINDLKVEWQDIKEQGMEVLNNESLTQQQKNYQYSVLFNQFSSMIADSASLYELDADYTIVWFWEPSCSHCRKATPKLNKLFQKIEKYDIQVYAVFLQAFVQDWKDFSKHINDWFDFIVKNDLLHWINVWDVYQQNDFRTGYGIQSSPVLYLLNDKKEIIAKGVGYKQAVEIIFDKMIIEDRKELSESEMADKIKDFDETLGNYSWTKYLKTAVDKFVKDDKKGKSIKYLNKRIEDAEKDMKNRFDDIVKKNSGKDLIAQLKKAIDEYNTEAELNYIKSMLLDQLDDKTKEKIKKHIEDRIKYRI